MVQIGKLDRSILYELGSNSRISYKNLAKKIKSKKTVVSYHIQNLTKEKIICKYIPVFSLNRLGLHSHKIFFKFHGLDKKKKDQMIKDLIEDPLINWVAESVGAWDLLISTFFSNIMDFADMKNEFFKKYGPYVQDYSVTIIEDALIFNRDYLVDKKLDYRKRFVLSEKKKLEKIDDTQKQILRLIRNNGRFQITKIAKDLNLNVRTVMSKISNLEKRKIIQGYTTFLDVNKIGFKFFKLCIYLQDFTKEKYDYLINYCKLHKNVIWIIKSIGDWDLELEIEAENLEYIYNLVEEIKTNYPKIVKSIDVSIIIKEHKLCYFPEWY